MSPSAPTAVLLLQAHLRYQFTMLMRTPEFWVPTIVLPGLLQFAFGSFTAGSPERALEQVVSFCLYGAGSVAFFQFAVGLAQDRESAWEMTLQRLPGASGPRTVAHLCAALAFSVASASWVLAVASVAQRVPLTVTDAATILFVSLAAAVPYGLAGVLLGHLASARAVVPVANVLFLAQAYLSGLLIPPAGLPEGVQAISALVPARHIAEAAWALVAGRAVGGRELAVIAATLVVLSGATALLMRREQSRRVG
jgi:ABC-2 type transport system permease protein